MIWFNPNGEILCFINFPWFINVETQEKGLIYKKFGYVYDKHFNSILKLEKDFKITNQSRLKKQAVKQFLIGTK